MTEHGHRVMGVIIFSATCWILSEYLLRDGWSVVMLSTYSEDAHSLGSHNESVLMTPLNQSVHLGLCTVPIRGLVVAVKI